MPANLDLFKRFLLSISKDDRITVWHIAVIFGIIQLANDETDKAIFISRKKVMELSHVGSIVTYHKCMKELQQFGYIQYTPSYHPGIRSTVFLLKNDKLTPG